MRKRLALMLSLVLAAVGVSALFASPAMASPQCYTSVAVRSHGVGIAIPSAGSTAASTDCTMGQGALSQAVQILQLTLNACYGAGLQVDWEFGPLTKAALRAAQSAEGASADGVYGPQTRNALRWYGNCQRVDQPITRW